MEKPMGNLYNISFEIKAMDFQAAGKASTKIKSTLQKIGLSLDIVRRASIISYEMEMNLVIHGEGGTLVLIISPEEIIIRTIDEGPGIPDIEKAMEEGYSTAGEKAREMGFGAGMGLPNIKKNSDFFKIDSQVGKGTLVESRVKIPN